MRCGRQAVWFLGQPRGKGKQEPATARTQQAANRNRSSVSIAGGFQPRIELDRARGHLDTRPETQPADELLKPCCIRHSGHNRLPGQAHGGPGSDHQDHDKDEQAGRGIRDHRGNSTREGNG